MRYELDSLLLCFKLEISFLKLEGGVVQGSFSHSGRTLSSWPHAPRPPLPSVSFFFSYLVQFCFHSWKFLPVVVPVLEGSPGGPAGRIVRAVMGSLYSPVPASAVRLAPRPLASSLPDLWGSSAPRPVSYLLLPWAPCRSWWLVLTCHLILYKMLSMGFTFAIEALFFSPAVSIWINGKAVSQPLPTVPWCCFSMIPFLSFLWLLSFRIIRYVVSFHSFPFS